MESVNQLCTFQLGDMWLGVGVENVQEVIRHQELTTVPLATRTVQGLINLRGQIVTVIDLRYRLRMGEVPDDIDPINVVLRSDDGAVSIPVDAIGDVIEVNADSYEDPPETLSGDARELIAGVYKLTDHLLLVLDVEKTVCCDAASDGNGDYTPQGGGQR